MVLLTSSQVGVLLSSIVVFLCTSALFLSGYVLQQKTVNDIRLAIKPQIAPLSPDIDLPPFFRDKDYWNGREAKPLLIQQGDNHGENKEDESMLGATRWQKAKKLKERKEADEAKKQNALLGESKKVKKSKAGKKGKGKAVEEDGKPLSRAERRKQIKEQILADGEGEAPQGYRRKWY